MTISESDPLALRDQPTFRMALVLPTDTALALYHYCLRSGADVSKLSVAAARIVALFLDRDVPFKRWRNEHTATLPEALPDKTDRPARRGARRA